MGALFMGNRPLVKVDSKVSVVFEQFVRMLIACGLSPDDVDLLHCRGARMGELIDSAADRIRMVQFTGSSPVAERVAATVNGRVRIEDAGFDWKVLGPDFDERWADYVAWQADEDAYNATGQKCSAQSILFVHDNWVAALEPRLKTLAARRNLGDLTNGPVLTWTNAMIGDHIDAVLTWFADPAHFEGPVRVLLTNMYDPTDGVGQIDGCFLDLDFADRLPVLQTYNAGIRSLAETHGAAAIDMYGLFEGHGVASSSSWFGDCQHPNDLGHHELRKAFLAAMR